MVQTKGRHLRLGLAVQLEVFPDTLLWRAPKQKPEHKQVHRDAPKAKEGPSPQRKPTSNPHWQAASKRRHTCREHLPAPLLLSPLANYLYPYFSHLEPV